MKDKIEQAIEVLIMTLKAYCPYDTGQLSNVGIRKGVSEIPSVLVGGDPADYAVYTNEPWVSPKWNGKKNPNQDWIGEAIEAAKPIIQDIFKDNITPEEVREYSDSQQLAFIKKGKQKYYDI